MLVNHTLTITIGPGKHIRSKVVYLQPKSERWREGSAIVHMESTDWLDPYGYSAIYQAPNQASAGRLVVLRYKSIEQGYWYEATFDTEPKAAQVP